jgi:hypothetical protein
MSRTTNNGSTKKTCGAHFDGGEDKVTKGVHGAAVRAAFDILAPKKFDAVTGELIRPTVSELLAGAWSESLMIDLQRDTNGGETKLHTLVIVGGEVAALWVTATVHTGHTGHERMLRFIAKVQRTNGDVLNITPKATPSVRSCGCAYQMRGEVTAEGLNLNEFTEGLSYAFADIANEVRSAKTLNELSTGLANATYPQNFVRLRNGGGVIDTSVPKRIVR